MNRFMNQNKVSKEVQNKVRTYIEYALEEENSNRQYKEQFLSSLPETLKKDILHDLNGRILADNWLFSANFGLKFMREVSTKLQERLLCPGEIIYLVRYIPCGR